MQLGVTLGIPYTLGKPAAAFSPLDLSPVLWLDASDTSTITESGGAVSQWDDKSGNGYNATQATAANQPTSGTVTQNGKNVIDFDGSADYMETGFVVGELNTSQAMTLFYVVSTDTTATGIFVSANQSGYTRDYSSGFVFNQRSSAEWEAFIGDGTNGTAGVSTFLAYNIVATSATSRIMTVEVDAGTSTFETYYDDQNGLDTTHGGTMSVSNFLANATANHLIRVGAGLDGSISSYLNGWIAEVILYDSVLTTTNREAVRDYLNAKWAVY